MNTGIQNAYTLGWKVDAVLRGRAREDLLDTYKEERMPVARSVLTGSDLGHSAIFSPHPVMTFLRDRVLVPALRLEVVQTAMLEKDAGKGGLGGRGLPQHLVGPRGRHTGLCVRRGGRRGGGPRQVPARPASRRPRAGCRRPRQRHQGADVPVRPLPWSSIHAPALRRPVATDAGYERLAATARQVRAALGDDVRAYVVVPAECRPRGLDGVSVLLDPDRDADHRYGVSAESLYLVRPDGYIAFHSQPAAAQPVLDHLALLFTVRTTV